MFKLKPGQESFTPVEGPLARRDFVPGRLYKEVPPGTEGRFEVLPDPDAAASAAGPAMERPARSGNRRGAVEAPESGEVQ